METALGVWAVLAGALLAGAIGALLATVPAWGWAALAAYVLLSGVALLSFTDLASRNFLAGTLRHRTYTQIYTTLTRRLLMPLWAALCDEPGNPKQMEREPIPVATLFRHALTWRLYDKALLIAVAYPILLPLLQWLVTGEAILIGNVEFIPATPFWWDRAAVLSALAILLLGFVVRKLASASRHRIFRLAANWLFVGAFVSTITVAGTVAVLFSGPFPYMIATSDKIGLEDTSAKPIAILGALIIGGFAVAAAVVALRKTRWRTMSGRLSILYMTIAAPTVVIIPEFAAVPEDLRSLFLFLAVLPLINALFDTLSYAVTLTLLRRGLRSRLPLLWGLLDLALACLLFLALGATLIVVIHGLNTLAGVPLADLPALLAAIHERPGDYLWLYAMLFSTIVPTAAHGLLSLLGVQGLWPRAWRRPVATWVEGATASAMAYLRAGLALGVIWTLPLLALGGFLWLLWALGGDAVTWALRRYFDLLLWLAASPVGAL
jgi:hypothetical protein